jgi:signal transduction histidine kinase
MAWNLLSLFCLGTLAAMPASMNDSATASKQKMHRRLWVLPLLLTMALVALASAGILRKFESFQPLGFTARPAGAGWRVETVDAAGSPLLPGDQIFQIDGRDATSLQDQLRGRAESQLLLTRGDELLSVTYQRPPLDVDYPYLVLLLVGSVYLLIGLYTLVRHRRRPGLLFFLWCMTSAAIYLLSPVPPARDGLDKAIYLVDALARFWLPGLTLHLFLVFPDRLGLGTALRRAVPFLYLPAAVFTTLQADLALLDGRFLFPQGLRAALPLMDRLELLHFIVYGLAAVVVLTVRVLRHRSWEQHRQVLWIAVGLAGGYLPFAVLYLLPWFLGLRLPEAVETVAVLPLALVPVAFAWAILRYKLWDIGVIVRETLSSTLTLMLGVVGFSVVHLAVSRGLPEDLVLARNTLSFLAGLTIAGLLVPTRQRFSAGLERLQYRGSFFKRRALADLAEELLRERDLVQLCRRLTGQLAESVPLSRVNLYLVQGSVLRPIDHEAGLPEEIAFEDLGERIWEDDVHPISATALPAVRLAASQHLFLAGYRYAFPLNVMSHRVGLVLCGYKSQETPLNSDDIELIRQILDQASLAIENAQLLDQLQQRLDEMVELQRYSEGIIESSPAGIAVLDAENRIVSANAAFTSLAAPRRVAGTLEGHGVGSPGAGNGGGSSARHGGSVGPTALRPADLKGKPFDQILPIHPLPGPEDGLLEVSYCDLTGAERHLQISVSTFRRDGDSPLRILVIHDVSERVAMENALKESDRLAALGMLAAGVAHEVNTPENDPRYELLKKVERQTFRAARIVNNLLEFARNKGSEQRSLDVVPLIGETLELLRERFQQRRIRIQWQPPETPVRVRGNGGELQQVLTNLFVNGCDAMTGGNGTLTIGVGEQEDRVTISVEDTGVGIPPERLETIFQPFFSTKLNSGGTGLGLSISYEIVRRHGGDLRAESRPGEGSRFVVELPKATETS